MKFKLIVELDCEPETRRAEIGTMLMRAGENAIGWCSRNSNGIDITRGRIEVNYPIENSRSLVYAAPLVIADKGDGPAMNRGLTVSGGTAV